MRRRQLLANLVVTGVSAVSAQVAGPVPVSPRGEAGLGDLLTSRVRDAMLGLAPAPANASAEGLRDGLAVALADFNRCQYNRLTDRLPLLISAGHLLAGDGGTALAGIYTLATRMLIKLDQPLGWVAAERARILAARGGDPLIGAEAARNLAVLARRAGLHEQATSIALTAARSSGLCGADPRLAAERGLLLQSAAYTAACAGDRDGMRDMTDEVAAIAARLGSAVLLCDHGGGFTPATVQLHRIASENSAGDPGAAIAAARQIPPASLPTAERRARLWTDTARAFGRWGRRQDCIHALLAAEHEAPERGAITISGDRARLAVPEPGGLTHTVDLAADDDPLARMIRYHYDTRHDDAVTAAETGTGMRATALAEAAYTSLRLGRPAAVASLAVPRPAVVEGLPS